ncbi:MAG: RusA family crossover junction endodeoxyribonuclease [Thermoguttaceae bacterium]
MPETVTFFVPGNPVPKGSMTAYYNKHLRQAVLVQNNEDKVKAWEKTIRSLAWQAWAPRDPTSGPVHAGLVFWFDRPAKHYRTGKYSNVLRDDAPVEVFLKKWDGDKLQRPVFDAMTGIIYDDDGRVSKLLGVEKLWSNDHRPGVEIRVIAQEIRYANDRLQPSLGRAGAF